MIILYIFLNYTYEDSEEFLHSIDHYLNTRSVGYLIVLILEHN